MGAGSKILNHGVGSKILAPSEDGAQLISRVTPLVAAANNIVLPGLNGNNQGGFVAYFRVINNQVADNGLSLLLNGSGVGISLNRIYGTGAAVFNDVLAAGLLASLAGGGGTGVVEVLLPFASTGMVRRGMIRYNALIAAGSEFQLFFSFLWSDTVSNIVSVGLGGSIVGGFGLGSEAKAYQI